VSSQLAEVIVMMETTNLVHHCKLRKFVIIFTHIARPSTQFDLRCTKMRLAAGLDCPNTLGELTVLPQASPLYAGFVG